MFCNCISLASQRVVVFVELAHESATKKQHYNKTLLHLLRKGSCLVTDLFPPKRLESIREKEGSAMSRQPRARQRPQQVVECGSTMLNTHRKGIPPPPPPSSLVPNLASLRGWIRAGGRQIRGKRSRFSPSMAATRLRTDWSIRIEEKREQGRNGEEKKKVNQSMVRRRPPLLPTRAWPATARVVLGWRLVGGGGVAPPIAWERCGGVTHFPSLGWIQQ
jgi:hypothetical protein